MVVVVMRVTTLKVPAAKVGRLLAYYAGLAEDPERPGPARGPVDYYLDPDEPPGRWWGDGCAALGLAGPVDGADLRSLLEAEDPRTGDRLGRRFGNASARGFDATFSAPKSVSVLWALSPDPWVRAEVLAAHDAAVDAAMGWFQRHGAVTRRGTDGLFQVDTLGVTAALFRQHTSRTVDPQLHTHAVISSKVQDESGGWFALDARFLKRQQRTIGWIYDAALRGELTARLGVEWREHDGMVEDLACISADLRDGFSKRSNQVAEKHSELIRRWSASHDGADPDTRTIASLERDAAKKSRPDKEHGIDAAVLRAEWVDEARRLGHDPEHLIAKAITFQGWPDGRVHDEDLIDEALLHASDEASTWLRADLARHLATIIEPYRCPTAVAVVEEIDRLATLAEKRCTALGPERNDTSRHRRDGRPLTEHVTDRRFTNPGVFRQEEELQAWAASHTRPVGSTADPQRAAALAIAGHDQLVVVVGPAGTGKTHTTAVAVGVLQARGRPVVGLAPSGKAADVLATEAHCPTDTVAGFLTRNRGRPTPWPAGTTVLLDEAGMAATADLARLVDLVRLNRWRLVAVGDPAARVRPGAPLGDPPPAHPPAPLGSAQPRLRPATPQPPPPSPTQLVATPSPEHTRTMGPPADRITTNTAETAAHNLRLRHPRPGPRHHRATRHPRNDPQPPPGREGATASLDRRRHPPTGDHRPTGAPPPARHATAGRSPGTATRATPSTSESPSSKAPPAATMRT
ncbi:MAG: relaxase domain-containing protein [Microthrixaceae bacterium]|nr:relaxase domain-containing protein [Microthrixaceae bacterium]